MKKLIAFLLVFIMSLSMLVGCDAFGFTESETGAHDPALPKTYNLSGLNIELPSNFVETSGGYENGDFFVRAFRIPFRDITPLEGKDFPTLEEFMKEMPTLKDTDQKVIKSRDGIRYIDYESTSKNVAQIFCVESDGDMQCVMGFETDSAFYMVSFYSPTLSYEQARDQAFEWAKSITPAG